MTTKRFFAGLLSGFLLCAVFLIGFAAGTGTRQPLPSTWGTATTGFGLNVSGVPVATIAGTNFSGSSTNLALTNLFKAQFKNGLYIGEVPLTQ
jgi:hypothetical protein